MTRTHSPPVAAFDRPPARDVGLLAVAIAAVSTSAPLIAATAVPALAISFWRNALASAVLVPTVALRRRHEVRALSRRDVLLSIVAGLLLAAHFATWVPSVTLSSVTSATALVATQPVFAVGFARWRGERVSRTAWVGTLLAVAGAATVTGLDIRVSGRALGGDLLALAGAAFAAAYVTVGGEARRSVSTTTYTAICYGTAAVPLLAAAAASGAALSGYDARDWWRLVALTAGAQLLGHSVVNRVLRTTSATVTSLAILFEVPGASLLAWAFLGQRPSVWAVPAVVLLLLGVAVVVRASGAAPPPPVE